MADYVEKFKASDPFNMEGFNTKIDQTNTALEAAQAAGMKVVTLFEQGSGSRVNSVNIANVVDKAILFVLITVAGTPTTNVASYVIPNSRKLLPNTTWDSVMPIAYKISNDVGGYRVDLMYYSINSTQFTVLGHCAPNSSFNSEAIISALYAIY